MYSFLFIVYFTNQYMECDELLNLTYLLNKMAENWIIVLMGATTGRKFETIIEKDCGLEIDMFFTF